MLVMSMLNIVGAARLRINFGMGGLRHFAELLRAAVGICHEKTSLSL